MIVKIKLLSDEAMPPHRATDGAAGFDVYACLGPGSLETLKFKAGEVKKVPLGFACEIDPSHYADIRGRSGHTLAGKFVVELGTIDPDYRNEVCAIVRAYEDFTMVNGLKVAQMIFHRRESVSVEMDDALSETVRGGNGFGSTGQ